MVSRFKIQPWFSLVAALLLGLCMALPAAAAKKPGVKRVDPVNPAAWERFKALDKDANGEVTLEEFQAVYTGADAEAQFNKLDTDHDHKLSYPEFKVNKLAPPKAAPVAKGATDKKPEAKEAVAKDADEKKAVAKQPAKPAAVAKKKGAGRKDAINPATWEQFKAIDKDGNGEITLEEYQAANTGADAEAQFNALDTDHDHKLSYPEFKGAKPAPAAKAKKGAKK